jgi:xanthine/uracil/vitamin C permease (AzgA family)
MNNILSAQGFEDLLIAAISQITAVYNAFATIQRSVCRNFCWGVYPGMHFKAFSAWVLDAKKVG